MKHIKPVINLLILLFIFLSGVILYSCQKKTTPKPRGYFRIDFPEKEYKKFDTNICPYKFEYPSYGKVIPSTSEYAEPCWYDIIFPDFKGKIYLSYKQINSNLPKLLEDAREMTYKHSVKADAIKERIYSKPADEVYGMLYTVQGDAASAYQFFLTDSVDHFLRGSLYFNTVPDQDSLAPVLDFFQKDIVHLMETLKWKD
jgi:gliding motility-associated lipoprotein GldD